MWSGRDGSSRSTFRVGCLFESDESVESGAFFLSVFESDVFDDGGIVTQEDLGIAVGHAVDEFLTVLFDFLRFPDQFEEVFVSASLVFDPEFDEDLIDLPGFVGVDNVIRVLLGLVTDGFRDRLEDPHQDGCPLFFPAHLVVEVVDIVLAVIHPVVFSAFLVFFIVVLFAHRICHIAALGIVIVVFGFRSRTVVFRVVLVFNPQVDIILPVFFVVSVESPGDSYQVTHFFIEVMLFAYILL